MKKSVLREYLKNRETGKLFNGFGEYVGTITGTTAKIETKPKKKSVFKKGDK